LPDVSKIELQSPRLHWRDDAEQFTQTKKMPGRSSKERTERPPEGQNVIAKSSVTTVTCRVPARATARV
jgi:hypothetical protein